MHLGLHFKIIFAKLKRIISNNYRDNFIDSDEEIIKKAFPNLVLSTYSYLATGSDAKSIIDYFSSDTNKDVISKLVRYGVNTKYLGGNSDNIDDRFYNKTFVLTGTLEGFTRDEASEIIEK